MFPHRTCIVHSNCSPFEVQSVLSVGQIVFPSVPSRGSSLKKELFLIPGQSVDPSHLVTDAGPLPNRLII